MTTLFLCAAGNPEGVRLAIEVNEADQRWDHIVLLDDDPAKQGLEILGVPVVGGFGSLAGHQPGDEAVNLVARSTKGRNGARAKIESFGIPLVSLIHPSTDVRWATIGQSVTIYAGCTISAQSTVGNHAVVFTQAVLGHGASLGDGAVLAPGAVVNARVQIGNSAYIGSNASVLPDLAVGVEATVSACSAAICDIPADCTALGVPAEIMGGLVSTAPLSVGDKAPHEREQSVGTSASLKELQAAFAQVLNMPSINREANFFDAGGTSKMALELQVSLREKFGLPVTIVDVFRFPTPGRLAAHLFGGKTGQTSPSSKEIINRRRRLRLDRSTRT
ncbi:transferase hexapeptide repeat [Roseobacter sp. SK209-2-6]|uniref:phosphopantetheine-binding protein n=1 Tax=Roseobacter sp. SK209-2-6 TaxID=388739 RepID=UPI0000F3E773|nr:acyltransferase [Roseobacter sp. SK209-2-6]EBA16115.1 transferase hexapeptide repeat [Roseobacter sp. SK209-2-6]